MSLTFGSNRAVAGSPGLRAAPESISRVASRLHADGPRGRSAGGPGLMSAGVGVDGHARRTWTRGQRWRPCLVSTEASVKGDWLRRSNPSWRKLSGAGVEPGTPQIPGEPDSVRASGAISYEVCWRQFEVALEMWGYRWAKATPVTRSPSASRCTRRERQAGRVEER